jgi:hypothetical protein
MLNNQQVALLDELIEDLETELKVIKEQRHRVIASKQDRRCLALVETTNRARKMNATSCLLVHWASLWIGMEQQNG